MKKYADFQWGGGGLIGIMKHKRFLIRGIQLSFYKLHSPRTGYHSKTEWVPNQIKRIHKSNG